MDLLYVFILLFVFAIGTLVSYVVWEEWKGATNSSSSIQLNSTTFDHVMEKGDEVSDNWNYIFVFILVGLTIILVISTFTLKTHPAFFWISLLLLAIFLVIAAVFSNVYEEIGQNPELQPAHDKYNIIEFVLDRFPKFMLLVGAIVLIALYAKSKFSTQY